MAMVFADTQYWIAILDPRDQWHDLSVALAHQTTGTTIVVTDEILVELLNAFSGRGAAMR
jgi:predicted nucleic acid-binding protein